MHSQQDRTRSTLKSAMIRWPGPIVVISLAQLFGTSLWFSANSTASDIMRLWGLSIADIGWLTSAVQLGFITGTLAISLRGHADRYPASRIFVFSSILGAILNACFAWLATGFVSALFLRFLVGVTLAGIYPLGMKLIVSWEPSRTGMALAQLVAMLTLGTALPHAMKVMGADLPWQAVISGSSLLALIGALLIHGLGDGPHLKSSGNHASPNSRYSKNIFWAFSIPKFRSSAIGYFGHMWELYAFWTIVPSYVSASRLSTGIPFSGDSGISFLIVGAGAVGCVLGGWLSRFLGSPIVAAGALALSGFCCALFALEWQSLSDTMLFWLLLVWGMAVVADSPHFSALSAKACPPQVVGSALAIQSSVGFAITIVSITLVSGAFGRLELGSAWLLLPGPIVGLVGFRHWLRRESL